MFLNLIIIERKQEEKELEEREMKRRRGKEKKEETEKYKNTHIYIYMNERDIYDHTAIGGTILHKNYFLSSLLT